MKYDLTQDLTNSATALGKILARVPMGSRVLELGAATGYMTKYMKEQLSCSVSVVEIDPQACEQAACYAQDSFCGDLQQNAWFEHFSGKEFDCVMLSNVLEHVRNPLEILKNAKALLRQDGRVLIAVPNAAHNDVILNQLKEDWHYTDLGLLDRDHVYFYGHKNILDMLAEAGLAAVEEDFVYLATAKTEQQPECDLPAAVMEYLHSRRMGEVYQFVIDARPAEQAGAAAPQITEDKENTLVSKDEYIAHLESDIPVMKAYIESLEAERACLHADSRAFHEQSGRERAEAAGYQMKLEGELNEARGYIARLLGLSDREHAESAAYQQKLERELGEARSYIAELQEQSGRERAEAAGYQMKLEKELAEAQNYISQLQAQTEGSSGYQVKLEEELAEAQNYISQLQAQTEGSSGYQVKLEEELKAAQEYISQLQAQTEGSSGYQVKLEEELKAAQEYISQLQAQTEGSSGYQVKLEEELRSAQGYIAGLQEQHSSERTEAETYQRRLEGELAEARSYIAGLQEQFDRERAEAGTYQQTLEKDLAETKEEAGRALREQQEQFSQQLHEAQAVIAQLKAGQASAGSSEYQEKLESGIAEAREYIVKLEADIAELNEALDAFRAEKEEMEQRMKTVSAECAEYKGKCFTQLEKLQQLEMAHKGVCNELQDLKQEYEKIMSSPVWKMSKPLRSISESIIGKKE